MASHPILSDVQSIGDVKQSVFFCPLCSGSSQHTEVYRQNGCIYYRCQQCELIALHPVPDEATLRSFYNHDYAVDFKGYVKNIRRGARAALADLRERCPSRGSLLEIGCSYGGFLAEARQDGWNVTGIELSEDAVRYAREQNKLTVFSGDVASNLDKLGNSFDVIVSLHVLEHLPDPVQFLLDCGQVLKPGGLLILKTPNVSSLIAKISGSYWQWVSPPAHLFLYCRQTLNALLQRTGYESAIFRSSQGDANNNFFAALSSVAKRTLVSGRPQALPTLPAFRRSLPVRIIEELCEFCYLPCRVLVDPWLNRTLLQPELYVLAVKKA